MAIEKKTGAGKFIFLTNLPMDAPKNILGAGSKIQKAKPSKVKHPENSAFIKRGIAIT